MIDVLCRIRGIGPWTAHYIAMRALAWPDAWPPKDVAILKALGLPVTARGQREADALNRMYRAADVCVVTSLHDGMNLVCKEFVAARDDDLGVLILSRFAGAAREMAEALIVNPYHVEETADALHRALTMPVAEQRERMASLRVTVREFNVFRWAGRMLADAGRWRLRERIEARVQRHKEL